MGRLALTTEAGELGVHDTCHPVHDEDLATGELPGLVQHSESVLHVPDAAQQRNLRRMLGAQQPDGAEIERFLSVGEARPEFLEARGQELYALRLPVGVPILRHQQEKKLRIPRGGNGVYRFQVFKVRAAGGNWRVD